MATRRARVLVAAIMMGTVVGATEVPAGAVAYCFGQPVTIDLSVTPGVDGTPGNDVIIGGPGTDFIDGGAGNDIICSYGSGGDWLWGGHGDDILVGGMHNDTMLGGPGNDVVYGGAGNDFIGGGAGNDVLISQAGDDLIEGEGGIDYLDGGEGDDDLRGNTASTQNDGGNTIIGGPGNDELTGADGPDVLIGDAGSDVIHGHGGNDYGWGGAGDDTILGYGGDDYLDGAANDDDLRGGDGNDVLLGGIGVDDLAGEAGADYLHGGDGLRDGLSGGNGNDWLDGSNTDDLGDIFWGGSGNDIILGFGGNDFLYGHAGADYLWGGEGDDYSHAGDGDDYLEDIGNGNDSLSGGNGNDVLLALGGHDNLHGEGHPSDTNPGNDYLVGGAGNDLLAGDGGTGDICWDENGSPSTGYDLSCDSSGLAANLNLDRPINGWVGDGLDGEQESEILAVLQNLGDFVSAHDIGATSFAVSLDQQPIAEVTFGWSDRDQNVPITTNAAFRLASVTKPYTHNLALQLEAQGDLNLYLPVFCRNGQTPGVDCYLSTSVGATPADSRVFDILVIHLFEHTGGWNRVDDLDPMFVPLRIQSDLGLNSLPDVDDVIAWMLGRPLQQDPGSTRAYSNFGYAVAGRVLEEATGRSYKSLMDDYILGPRGLQETFAGRSLVGDRRANEVEYACDHGTATNVFDVGGPRVCRADGGFQLENMTAHGALVSTSGAVLEFLDDWCILGGPAHQNCLAYHSGSLDGTYTLAVNHGRLNYVILFNRRTDSVHGGNGYAELGEMLSTGLRPLID